MKVIRYTGYSDLELFIKRAEKLNLERSSVQLLVTLVFDLDQDTEELNNLAEDPTPEIQSLMDEVELFFRENVEYSR